MMTAELYLKHLLLIRSHVKEQIQIFYSNKLTNQMQQFYKFIT